jgi:shikimate 5-dehydrogenase
MTSETLVPASVPTLYFIGVTTGRSSIQRVFPRWANELGLEDARLQGIDLPLHAPSEAYRKVVDFIAADDLSLGALVTTHKIDLYSATSDRFDYIDPLAIMMGETSCISKSELGLSCHAKDPISSGLALEAFVPSGHFARTGAEVFSMGAGGSTIAISWYLSGADRLDDVPSVFTTSNRSQPRLDHLAKVQDEWKTTTRFNRVLAPTPEDNDRLVAALPPGSLVINATGLGKDAPGSPITEGAVFPEDGLAWELNYRGDLVFLDQARRSRSSMVEDGWAYFLHGWTEVIGEVFHVRIPPSGEGFERLSKLAESAR